MTAFEIDGYSFGSDDVMITDLTEKAEILTGKNSGRRQDFNMYIEYGGTFFNHSFVLHKRGSCTQARWDDLFMILSNPVNNHSIRMPHKQGYLIYDAYISSATRKLISASRGNDWGDITVEFIAMSPQWRAYDSEPTVRT